MQPDLLRLASAARAYLEPVWRTWHQAAGRPIPAPPSTHTCGRSSLFLRNILRAEGHPAEWTNGIARPSESEADRGPFGFFAGRRWENHAWVVSGGLIIDITADQFGAAPVIVTPLADRRYSASGIDTADPRAIEARYAAVQALWPGWLAWRATGGI